MKKFERFVVTFLSIFVITFAFAFFAKVIIDAIIFDQNAIIFKYVYWDIIACVIASVILTLFYQINKISTSVQALVTYVVAITTVYVFGAFSGWFSFSNIVFVLISISFNVVGLFFVVLFLFIKHKMQNKELNEQLASFKERGQNEEN